MHKKASRFGVRTIGVSLATLAVVLTFALPGQAWADQNESSTKTITGTVTEIVGNATGGTGIAGPAMAMNTPIVIQQNIQVDTTGNPNNNQTATNVANVNQDTGAMSGNADGTNGGVATSGAANAHSLAIILQLNIQVITGFVPDGGVSQTASNTVDLNQGTAAVSGNTDADGAGSSATSGGATSNSSAYLGQINVQIYSGSYGGTDTTGAIEQQAANTIAAAQGTAGQTGTATASDGGTSSSGTANASSVLRNWQLTRQYR
jgi:hypothetical protein